MEFSLNKTYNFTTLAPAILGTSFKSMKVKGIMASNEAIKYRDIATLHNKLIYTLSGLPSSINDLTYILFENVDNEKLLLAYEYIDKNSIQEVKTINIRIEIYDTNTEDISILRTRMLELGYNNININSF